MQTPIRNDAVTLCPCCGMRRTWRALSRSLTISPVDLQPTLWGCFNQRGQRGCQWVQLTRGHIPPRLLRDWVTLKARVSERLIDWLDRFGVDRDGKPIVLRVYGADELARERAITQMAANSTAARMLGVSGVASSTLLAAPSQLVTPSRTEGFDG